MSWSTIRTAGDYSLESNSGDEFYMAKSKDGWLIEDSFVKLSNDRMDAIRMFNGIVALMSK